MYTFSRQTANIKETFPPWDVKMFQNRLYLQCTCHAHRVAGLFPLHPGGWTVSKLTGPFISFHKNGDPVNNNGHGFLTFHWGDKTHKDHSFIPNCEYRNV